MEMEKQKNNKPVEEKIELVLRVAFGNSFERHKSEPADAFQFILE